jgi:hypothetical protein
MFTLASQFLIMVFLLSSRKSPELGYPTRVVLERLDDVVVRFRAPPVDDRHAVRARDPPREAPAEREIDGRERRDVLVGGPRKAAPRMAVSNPRDALPVLPDDVP